MFKINPVYKKIKTAHGTDVNGFFGMFRGMKTIQTFDDSKLNRPNLTRIIHFNGVMDARMEDELNNLNANCAGIYMAVNETDGQGRTAANVIRVRSVFVDLDGSPFGPTLRFDPTVIVESSGGRFHCYWFTNDTPLLAFSPLQKILYKKFDGDNKCVDLSRVLRVPGFYHHKAEPFLTKIIGGSGRIFSYRELVEMFPPDKVVQFSAKRYHLDKKGKDTEFRGEYGAVYGSRNDHLIRRAGGMIKRGKDIDYIRNELIKEGMACCPPLTENEIMQVFKSAQRYI